MGLKKLGTKTENQRKRESRDVYIHIYRHIYVCMYVGICVCVCRRHAMGHVLCYMRATADAPTVSSCLALPLSLSPSLLLLWLALLSVTNWLLSLALQLTAVLPCFTLPCRVLS